MTAVSILVCLCVHVCYMEQLHGCCWIWIEHT
jgi:hypothetical protein